MKKQKEKVCPICNGDGYVRGKTGMVRCPCTKNKLYKINLIQHNYDHDKIEFFDIFKEKYGKKTRYSSYISKCHIWEGEKNVLIYRFFSNKLKIKYLSKEYLEESIENMKEFKNKLEESIEEQRKKRKNKL